MTNKRNFRWLENDIDNTLTLKVMRKIDGHTLFYGVFNVLDVLETTGDELDIETANIDDLTKLLTLGIVRFVNVIDKTDILDIPFRKLFVLYNNGYVLGKKNTGKMISCNDLDCFSLIDGSMNDDYMIMPLVVNQVSDDLKEVMNISYEFGNYGMQEKFEALSKVNLINHRRLVSEDKNRRKK